MFHFISSRTNNTNSLSQSEVGIQLFETLGLESEIQLVIKNLKKWAAPRGVEKNLVTLSDTLYIQPEPLGVVLVIGAWNYPWAVTMFPLIGAIAAGTVCVCVCVPFRHHHIASFSSTLSAQHLKAKGYSA